MSEPEEQTGTEPEESCGSCACDLGLDAADQAIIALGLGAAAMVFGTFGLMSWLHWLAVPLGAGAVMCGYQALKQHTPHEKAALGGIAFGVIGLAMFLVTSTWHATMRLLGW